MIDRAYPVVQTGTDTFRPRVVKLPRAHHLVDFYAGDVQGVSKPPLVNALDWITDVFFIADLALNFRTGYVRRETGVVDLDPARSRRHYLGTWFALDFVSSVPPIFGWVTYLVAAGSGGNLSPLRSVKLVRLLRIMKLMKMLRLAKFLRSRTARKSNFTAKNEFVKN